MIYVLKSNDLVKVGYTKDFKSRLINYKTHNPHIEVLYKYPRLTIALEKELHANLKLQLKPTEYKEWYEYRDDCLELIENTLHNIIVKQTKNVSVNLDNYVILPNGWVINLDLLHEHTNLKIFKTFGDIIDREGDEEGVNIIEIPYNNKGVIKVVPLYRTVEDMKSNLSDPIELHLYLYGEVDKDETM